MKKEIEKGEWFISSEHGFNKFKHGTKTFFVFVFLPIFSLQIIMAFFFLDVIFKEEMKVIHESFDVLLINFPMSFFENNNLLSITIIYFFKTYLLFFLYTSPIYFLVGLFAFKGIEKQTKSLLKKEHLGGAKEVNLIEVLESYLDKLNIKKFGYKNRSLEKQELIIKEKISSSYNFEIAGVPILKSSECSHFLIPGASGKGKSQLLRNLVFKAKELSIKEKAKGIITDEKGEWVSKTFSPENGDLIFNPADKRSLRWNIFNDIKTVIDIENFSEVIIPDNAGNKDQFWTQSARDILRNCLFYLWNTNQRNNKALRELINSGNENMYNVLAENLSIQAAEFLKKSDSYLSFKVYMKFIDYLEDGDFSISKWVSKDTKKGFIYITTSQKTKSISKTALTLFVNVLGLEILSLEDNYTDENKIYLFLEEFTSLNKLPIIIDILKLSRSKGCSLWLLFQDFQLIKQIYSAEEMSSIINNCSTLVSLGLNEPDAAEFFSKKFSDWKFKEFAKNHSMGIKENKDSLSLNEQKKKERIIEASELLYLENLKCIIKIDNIQGIIRRDIPINKDPMICKSFILNDNLSNIYFVKDANSAKINTITTDSEELKLNSIEQNETIDTLILNTEQTHTEQENSFTANLMKGL